MGRTVELMIRKALNAFVPRDGSHAQSVPASRDEVDDRTDTVYNDQPPSRNQNVIFGSTAAMG